VVDDLKQKEGVDGIGCFGAVGSDPDRNPIRSLGNVVTAVSPARGKPAWKIHQTVLIENHLAGFQITSAATQQAVQ